MRSFITIVENPQVAAFRNVTRDQFLGSPRITTAANGRDLKPCELTTVETAPREPFLDGRFEAAFSEDGAAVFDKGRLIASYNFGDTLVVDRQYRRKGIGQELVYQWRTRYPEAAPATHRTKVSQSIQQKVWDRIQREIGRD